MKIRQTIAAISMVLTFTASGAGTNQVDWVNVGSNSSLFAFDWESIPVRGMSLAGSPQSLRRGMMKIKACRKSLAPDAHVVVTLCLFSSVVPESYDKRPSAATHPLLSFDGTPDSRNMSGFADMLDKVWKKEFSIVDYSDPMSEENLRSYSENVARMRDFAEWCRNEGLRLVLVIPPAAKCLRDMFPDSFMQAYVHDFVRDVTKGYDVKFLDYWACAEFQDEGLYATSLFLNKTGRRRFTSKVVADVLHTCGAADKATNASGR